MNNPNIVADADEYLKSLEDLAFNRRFRSWEVFKNIPSIKKWEEILIKHMVSEKKIKSYIRSFWHVCKYLKRHPDKIYIEECVNLNLKMRELYYNNKEQPEGLAYLSIRESNTGTRINATLKFNFSENLYHLTNNMWMFEVQDKGKNGGIRWEKYLIGHALDSFKDYCSKRFEIPIDELESRLPHTTNHLFPHFVENRKVKDSIVRKKFKKALIDAGLSYKSFPPTHIWRHTFAQDFLEASNWNYELCGSLGGWMSTSILKKHYGEMGREPRLRGLRKAMGLPIKIETYELKF